MDVEALTTSAAKVFSASAEGRLVWAGVFGSFARAQQRDDSDVDVVLVFQPGTLPWCPPFLDDELREAWGRKADLLCIYPPDFTRYVDVEALLGSHTLFGDVAAVTPWREKARTMVLETIAAVEQALPPLEELLAVVGEPGSLSLARLLEDRALRDEVLRLLRAACDATDRLPASHFVRRAFHMDGFDDMDSFKSILSRAETQDFRSFWTELHQTLSSNRLALTRRRLEKAALVRARQSLALEKIALILAAGGSPPQSLYDQLKWLRGS